MRRVPCPPASPGRRPARWAVGVLAAALAAMFGLLPASAVAMPMSDDAGMSPHPPAQVQADPNLERVLKGLMCRCGCNLTVYACEGTMTCDVAAKMRADAEEKLALEMGPSEVLEAFAADYGEQVLAAPTKKGFNLTAWVLPFVALGVGGLVVAYALRTWRSRRPEQDEEPPPADPRYVAAVEEELSREV